MLEVDSNTVFVIIHWVWEFELARCRRNQDSQIFYFCRQCLDVDQYVFRLLPWPKGSSLQAECEGSVGDYVTSLPLK